MSWKEILGLLSIIWTAASPELKCLALAELQKAEVEEADQPVLLALIKKAEALIEAAK